VPGLHLMEQEGYRALVTLTGGVLEQVSPEEEAEVYRAPAMPGPARTVTDALQKRLRRAQGGFDNADRRLKLARVVLEGGFPEEVLRPVRQGLGWALSAHIALVKDRSAGPDLPAARLVHSELVESGRVPADLANRLSTVRELTAPPADEEEEPAPPPSLQTAETFIVAVQELVDLGRQLAAEAGL
jgi:HEPN domain-containing protein